MSNWLVFYNGAVIGPYSEQQIHKMLEVGTITPAQKICREKDGIWNPAEKFAEFQDKADKQDYNRETSRTGTGGKSAGKAGQGSHLRFKKQQTQTAPAKQDNSTLPAASQQVLKNGLVHFICPHCGQKYSCQPDYFNEKAVSCMACTKQFQLIPDFAEEPEPSSASQTSFSSGANADFSEDIPDGDIVCPHCWKTFSKDHVCYISCHPDLMGDSIAGEFEQKRFIPTVYHSNGLPLDAKGMPCTDMACPHCHLRLPASVVDLPSQYFSIAGAPSSGKSYFLTSMIHVMRKMLPSCDFSFYDVDPVINSVLNTYEDALFMNVNQDAVVSLPKTQQIGGDFSNQIQKDGVVFDLPKPFIFRLQSSGASTQGMDKNIIFYDNAGEHFQPGADSVANPATIHLSHSNGIIFLFDPLNDANMRRNCNQDDPQLELGTKVVDQTTLFAEMVNRIRRHGNLVSNQTSKIPVVVAVGKYDTWKDRLNKKVENIPIFVENGETLSMELNWNAIMDVSFAVREMMLEVAPALVSQAEAFFEDVVFIPVSSFGCLATRGEAGNIGIIPSNLKPIWADLPIDLLLCKNGVLPCNYSSSAQAVSGLVSRVAGSQIIFKHPVTGKRIQQPKNYSEVVLEINGSYYQQPKICGGQTTTGKSRSNSSKASIWE